MQNNELVAVVKHTATAVQLFAYIRKETIYYTQLKINLGKSI